MLDVVRGQAPSPPPWMMAWKMLSCLSGAVRHEWRLQVPDCYRHSPARLQPGYLSKFQVDTLFYIFYSMPNDEAQVLAADELRSRGWLFHKEFKVRSLLLPDQSLHVSATAYAPIGMYLSGPGPSWATGPCMSCS